MRVDSLFVSAQYPAIIEDSRGIPQIGSERRNRLGLLRLPLSLDYALSVPVLGFGAMKTVVLLICSNVFMTIAWYGHLKYKKAPLIAVIVVSWLIAFFEYCFQVPANRIGYGEFTAFQLKIIQEVITLCVFVAFAWIYLGEHVRWNHIVSFLFIIGAVVFGFWGKL
jgi:hypothetical protein